MNITPLVTDFWGPERVITMAGPDKNNELKKSQLFIEFYFILPKLFKIVAFMGTLLTEHLKSMTLFTG
jgi:hypothetical protein